MIIGRNQSKQDFELVTKLACKMATIGSIDGASEVQPDNNPLFMSTGEYSDVKFQITNIPPPTHLMVPQKAVYQQPDFKDASVISEGVARSALLKHVETQFCWGKGAATKLKFTNTQSSVSYSYKLETFTESRATKWEVEPYTGQSIDGPQYGTPPGPWEIPMLPTEQFKDIEVRRIEVPHTASAQECLQCRASGVQKCVGCEGKGGKLCNPCHGKGERLQRVKGTAGVMSMVNSRCSVCNGTGKEPCIRCSGTGQMKCQICLGACKVKMYVQLIVTWKTYIDVHIVGKANIPKELLSRVKGTNVFEDVQPVLIPITTCPEAEIIAASSKLIQQHRFPNIRILMQRHSITSIPITQCDYSVKSLREKFYVYGLDNRVHAPGYPETCCWGCEIM